MSNRQKAAAQELDRYAPSERQRTPGRTRVGDMLGGDVLRGDRGFLAGRDANGGNSASPRKRKSRDVADKATCSTLARPSVAS